MLSSMTGFGRVEALDAEWSWVWEVRSVNARGLEFRCKLPTGMEGLEPFLRDAAATSVRRGSVQATLTMRSGFDTATRVNEPLLEHLLQVAIRTAARIPGAEVPRVEILLAVPGVVSTGRLEIGESSGQLTSALKKGFIGALDALVLSRHAEGGRLGKILLGLIAQIDELLLAAESQAQRQPERHRDRLIASISMLLDAVPGLSEERIAQEVALLASKSDVREELDRLASHVDAARALLVADCPVGRSLDFLVQEFLRETNTLCSKSASRELTSIGLQLKGVVEQVREQGQNLE